GPMPAMTMPFRIVPRARAAQLQPGATIDADVSVKTEPWTLTNVTSTSAQQITEDASPLRRVTPLKLGDTVPDTPFVDQTGKPFRFSQLRGSDVVLAFVYTRCQDAAMCPLISAKFRQLEQKTEKRNLHLVEVTLDPTYDRPPVLARYGKTFGADPKRWSLVVGDAEPTLNFAAQFGITAFPDPTIGIIHAENTVLIDRDGRIRRMIGEASWLPDEIIAAVDAQDGVASNPLARLNLWASSTAVAICGSAVAGFSGLADLAVVVAIFGALAYLSYRVARKIFVEDAWGGSARREEPLEGEGGADAGAGAAPGDAHENLAGPADDADGGDVVRRGEDGAGGEAGRGSGGGDDEESAAVHRAS
ncbi:MAG: SCO family protein, partial [Candidatus Eremiobacteraeota bacterium]|nr:SCO family protein [Candidatus Eremiobacteraeota bacterium]